MGKLSIYLYRTSLYSIYQLHFFTGIRQLLIEISIHSILKLSGEGREIVLNSISEIWRKLNSLREIRKNWSVFPGLSSFY